MALKAKLVYDCEELISALEANQEQSVACDFQRRSLAEVRCIAQALATNSCLTALDLRYTNLGDPDLIVLAEALEQNSVLRSLSLGGNHLGADGMKRLAEALGRNHALEVLDLSYNNIGDHGMQHLSAALERGSTIQDLNLDFCGITDVGAKALAAALHRNRSLARLSLSVNRGIGSVGLDHLAEALEINGKLSHLKMNAPDSLSRGRLRKAVENNSQRVVVLSVVAARPQQDGSIALSLVAVSGNETILSLSSAATASAACAKLSEQLGVPAHRLRLAVPCGRILDESSQAYLEELLDADSWLAPDDGDCCRA